MEAAVHVLVADVPVGLVAAQTERRLARVPVPKHAVHVVLRPDAQKLVLVRQLLLLVVAIVVAVITVRPVPVQAPHLAADALKVLLDADLGEALGVLRARLVEHLALNVDVVRPVLGLEESGLGEAGADGAHQEGREGDEEEEDPAESLRAGTGHFSDIFKTQSSICNFRLHIVFI